MRRTVLFLGACALILGTAVGFGAGRSHPAEEDKALAEWKYPKAKIAVSGSSGADGRFASSSAIMLTRESYADVVKYYEKKFGHSLTHSGTSTTTKAQPPDGGTTFLQEDLADRPLKLRIFVQHQRTSSISVVVSRADGEDETHIAWTYFRP